VTDDTDGTDGVADILHSFSSMKTSNWKLTVPGGVGRNPQPELQ